MFEFLESEKATIRIKDKKIEFDGHEWWGYSVPSKDGKGWMKLQGLGFSFYDAWEFLSAQHRVHLTAFGVDTLAFLAGFGICWLVFVR